MTKRDYPKQIHLKVDDRVKNGDENAFNTDDQQKAAHLLKEHWPIEFTELAEIGDQTDVQYRKVLNRYFGPVDSDLTFDEVWEDYGTVGMFQKLADGGEDKHAAYERGFMSGFDFGYEKAKEHYSDE